MTQDHYDTLGVEPSADGRQIKRAYRQMALRYHPDQNPDDPDAESRFKRIAEAYRVLSDPAARHAYDARLRHARFVEEARRASAGAADAARGSAEAFGEFIGGLFGNAWRKVKARRGRDVSYPLRVDLEDLLGGVEVELEVPRTVLCAQCQGEGANEDVAWRKCERCRGLGETESSAHGRLETCPDCGGRGRCPAQTCAECEGRGFVRGIAPFTIHVPAGVESGHRVRHASLGEPGTGGAAAGDLFVVVEVAPHPLFERDSQDLICRVPLTVSEAALGTRLEIPTLEGGNVLMKVPPGTQHGRLFRVRGRGLPAPGSRERGDLYVEIEVETPVGLTARQRELLEALAESEARGNHPRRADYDARVRAHQRHHDD